MASLIWILLPALAAAALSNLLTPLVGRLAVSIGAVDLPGHRKIHSTPIPRLGGLAVVVSIIAVLLGLPIVSAGRWHVPPYLAAGLAMGFLPVFVISLVDDITSVGARLKFLAHALGATIAVAGGISLAPVVHLLGTPIDIGFFALPLSVLWIVGVTNAFNIIDGLDGLSAGLALISAAGMAAVFMLVGEWPMAVVTLVLAGALAGFLPYNVHPARLFLGDTGATAIGFCLAAFALRGGSTLSSGFAALLPVFILGLPIADTLITMARRTIGRLENRGGGMFEPDRNHIHHRLLAIGIDHGRAVLILYGTGLIFAIAAFVSVFLNVREAGLFIVALILAAFVGVQRLNYDEFAFLRRGVMLKVYEMPGVKRGMFVVFVDVFLAALVSYLAVALKADQWRLSVILVPVRNLATAFAPVTVLVFWGLGMYRGSWRIVGVRDLTRCFRAVIAAAVVGSVIIRMLSGEYALSLFVIYGTLSLVLTTSLRTSYAVLENTKLWASHQGRPVVVYGAGNRGVAAVRELLHNTGTDLKPIGFIDDDARRRGRLVGGLPVMGTAQDLETIIKAHAPQALLIASEKIRSDRIERVALLCKQAGVSVFRFEVKVELLGEMSSRASVAIPGSAVVAPMAPVSQVIQDGSAEGGAVESCPTCASRDVHRSKARNLYERIWRAHTPKRLFRCNRCGWRGWLIPLDSIGATAIGEVAQIDLSGVDEELNAQPRVATPSD